MTTPTKPPVSEGDILTLKCISQGKKGDGIFKIEKFVVIVPDTEVDEDYEIEITKVFSTVAFGIVTQK